MQYSQQNKNYKKEEERRFLERNTMTAENIRVGFQEELHKFINWSTKIRKIEVAFSGNSVIFHKILSAKLFRFTKKYLL